MIISKIFDFISQFKVLWITKSDMKGFIDMKIPINFFHRTEMYPRYGQVLLWALNDILTSNKIPWSNAAIWLPLIIRDVAGSH